MCRATVVVLAVVAVWWPLALHAQPDVTARGAIIVDADSGAVIWEYDADRPLPPASTTKVMTAVLALQSHRLDQQFTVSANAAATGGSRMGLRPGQGVALRDLLYAVLLKSANDASVVVAEGVAGSEYEFADRMNLKARVVGATTTNFVNPHGLTDHGHVTTARDLSRMFRYGLGVPGFREVLHTPAAAIPIEGPSARLARVRSHNRLLNAPDYQVIGKTGYTRPAKRCFVGAAGYGSREVVIAILGSSDLWGDARRMLYYGLSTDRPTPVLMASGAPPPRPAPEMRAAPPPSGAVARVPDPPPGNEPGSVPEAPLAAPPAALERAARMARAQPVEPVAEPADEPASPGGLDDVPRAGIRGHEEPRRIASPPDEREPDRPPLAEDYEVAPRDREVAPDVRRDVAPPPRREIIVPAVAEEPIEPASPREPEQDREQDRETEPAEPGALDDRGPRSNLWADSPLRDPADEPRPRTYRPARAVDEARAEPAIEDAPAPELARRSRGRRASSEVEERERPAEPTRARANGSRQAARADSKQRVRVLGTGSTSPRVDDRRKPTSASARALARSSRRPAEPSRQEVGLRRAAESSREDRGRRKTTRSRETRDDRERGVVLTRVSTTDARPTKRTARESRSEPNEAAKRQRGARRAPEADGADTARGAGKYTVQLGPYRDRKAAASARADLAKRGYEARVVGQKLELGNFSERGRADKLANRLRVNGHRATSAPAR